MRKIHEGVCISVIAMLCVVSGASGNENLLKVKVSEVVRAKFGSGPDNIEILTPSEANPEGPMSFTLGKKGEIYILDQVNNRVQVFKEGKRIKTVPIPFKTFVDIDVTPDSKILLLDNVVKKSVYILDSEGKTLNIIPLEGRQIPYAPSVIEIMCVKGGKFPGIWVGVEDRSVRIAMLDGTTTERIGAPGIFSWDGGRLMQAQKIGDATVAIYLFKKDKFSEYYGPITIDLNMYFIHLLGTSPNAVMTQIWTALIAILVLKYLKFRSTFNWSLSNLVAMLRYNLFTYRDLWEWINKPFEIPPIAPDMEQLSLRGI